MIRTEQITPCKICDSKNMSIFAHTVKCHSCGVLLYYPYLANDDELYYLGERGENIQDINKIKETSIKWHLKSGSRNHHNFTDMALFALDDEDRQKKMKILDYGGGGGQFALVLKSLFPLAEVFIVDKSNERLLDQFKPLNNQIRFKEFLKSEEKFDFVFMNDVFEHVNDPLGVLIILRKKMANSNSRIFIDTPCQFWLYPLTKILTKKIHTKLLRGTVSHSHLQIWSKKSFSYVVNKAGFSIDKYVETSEFTQAPEFYMDNMKITNPIMRFVGKLFYRFAPLVARNKILSVIKPL